MQTLECHIFVFWISLVVFDLVNLRIFIIKKFEESQVFYKLVNQGFNKDSKFLLKDNPETSQTSSYI